MSPGVLLADRSGTVASERWGRAESAVSRNEIRRLALLR